MSIREAKGRQIADRARIVKHGALYLVPSQSSGKQYKVDPIAGSCSCPDFEFTGFKCKHQYAVEFSVRRESKTVTETKADGTTKTTITETVTVKRKTYPQEWPAYNMAQTKEKGIFLYLLHKLCQGVGSPAQYGPGQRCLPLEDVIFAMAFKVYSTLSTRRFMTDLKDAQVKGYVEQLPSYNSIIRYFESEMLTPYLQMLIEESALPLAAIEQDFAADSTGLSGCRFVRWFSAKYDEPQLMEQRDWIKIHLMCGTTTNVVTAVEISEKYRNDSPFFKPLVDATARNFRMREVSADKGYDSFENRAHALTHGAMAYIPFRGTEKKQPSYKNKGELWKRMYHFYAFNTERFMQSYHKRSNVETTFHMIKSKFGDSLRSKTERAQINEALCKVLCHNICCLIQSMYELNLRPKFWKEVA
jgi:transposase